MSKITLAQRTKWVDMEQEFILLEISELREEVKTLSQKALCVRDLREVEALETRLNNLLIKSTCLGDLKAFYGISRMD